MRQLCAGLLRHHIRRVPGGPVLVALPGALFVVPEAVFAELHNVEAEKNALSGKLAELEGRTKIMSTDAKQLGRTLENRARNIVQLLGRHIAQTRQLLRLLIDGRIVCRPFDDERGKGYEITATGTYAGLFGEMAVKDGGGGQGI